MKTPLDRVVTGLTDIGFLEEYARCKECFMKTRDALICPKLDVAAHGYS